MEMTAIPFQITDWSAIPPTNHAGTSGVATWRTQQFGAIRVRMVEYSPGYVANHWCEKGHVLLCLDGKLETRLKDGRTFVLSAGMSYQVADGMSSHMSVSESGAKLFIVD